MMTRTGKKMRLNLRINMWGMSDNEDVGEDEDVAVPED